MYQKYPVVLFCCLLFFATGFSQKYKSIADTARLNQEYAQVSKDVADLTAKLDDAKKKQAELQAKANSSTANAADALNESNDQASKATGGSVKEARRARRKAKYGVHAAKDASEARDDAKDQNEKVEKLTKELDKRQKRLNDLEGMRSSIMSAPAQ